MSESISCSKAVSVVAIPLLILGCATVERNDGYIDGEYYAVSGFVGKPISEAVEFFGNDYTTIEASGSGERYTWTYIGVQLEPSRRLPPDVTVAGVGNVVVNERRKAAHLVPSECKLTLDTNPNGTVISWSAQVCLMADWPTETNQSANILH